MLPLLDDTGICGNENDGGKGYEKEKTMKKRILALACITMLLFSGCGSKKTAKNTEYPDFDFNGYPMTNAPKLTYWKQLNKNLSVVVDNEGKSPFAKGLEERTGVEIEYQHPVSGQEGTSLGLMIASGELPDMIAYNWKTYNGSPQKSIDDGVIIPLNDLMEEYAPNLTKFLKENPEIDKAVKTEEGIYYAVPLIRNGRRLLISQGPMYRRDLAKKAGINDYPKNIDEIEALLRAYKEIGVSKPLSFQAGGINNFISNFGVMDGFHLIDDKVVYGPALNEYKEVLERLNNWYEEGLLDVNYFSNDANKLKAQILNGETAMTYNGGGSTLSLWIEEAKKQGVEFDMVGFPFTSVAEMGDKGVHSISPMYHGNDSVAITTSCKNPAAALAFLDYAYSEEGMIYYNFGEEGLTHTLDENGVPVYTDIINNNPDGLTKASALAMYAHPTIGTGYPQDERYMDQNFSLPNQKESLDAWLSDYDSVIKNNLHYYYIDEAEQEELAIIKTDITKHVNTERDKFITGKRPIKEFDKYIKELKDYGLDRMLEIIQAGYDRYKNS